MPDAEKIQQLLRRTYGYLEGASVSGMIWLGGELGLYKAMCDAGPMTAAGLAARTGLSERWLLEWLRGQGAAGLLDYRGDDRFELSGEAATLLADESSVLYAMGAFVCFPQSMAVLESLPQSFRTGLGLPFDARGEAGSVSVEQMFAPWYRNMLVPVVLAGVPGLPERLAAGARVADVGCGAGLALIEIAKAYPLCELHGYEISAHALRRAEANKRMAGLHHVHFHDMRAEPLPQDASFDLVCTFDCLHDMTDPLGVLRAIRRALRPEGILLVAEIKARPTYEENVERNPMAAMMYARSVMSCMSSALSEPGGAGLGTLGLHKDLLRQMTLEAGFGGFEQRDFGHPVNTYYDIRI